MIFRDVQESVPYIYVDNTNRRVRHPRQTETFHFATVSFFEKLKKFLQIMKIYVRIVRVYMKFLKTSKKGNFLAKN